MLGFPAAPASEPRADAYGSWYHTAQVPRSAMLVHSRRLSAHRLNLTSRLRLYNRLRPSGPVCPTVGLRTSTDIDLRPITMPAYKSVPGADQFYPLNEPAIGTAYPEVCDTGRMSF